MFDDKTTLLMSKGKLVFLVISLIHCYTTVFVSQMSNFPVNWMVGWYAAPEYSCWFAVHVTQLVHRICTATPLTEYLYLFTPYTLMNSSSGLIQYTWDSPSNVYIEGL